MAFEVKYKAFFLIVKGLSFAKNHLRPESASLSKRVIFDKRYSRVTRAAQKLFYCLFCLSLVT